MNLFTFRFNFKYFIIYITIVFHLFAHEHSKQTLKLGGEYQKVCDKYVKSSINNEVYHQKVTKNSLLAFDEKRCFYKRN